MINAKTMIDDIDFLLLENIHNDSRNCFECNSDKNLYLSEWDFMGSNLAFYGGAVYCQDCIIKRYPTIKVIK